MNDIKEILLDAVPPLPAPPDRLAAIRGRAVARRRMHVTGTALAALASVVTLGTTMAVLTPPGPAERVGGGPASTPASGPPLAPPMPSGPAPSASGLPKDFPMPGPGVCPPSVDFMRMPPADVWPGGALPEISGVTLCRYAQSDFDLSKGSNSLTSGPRAGDLNTFRPALTAATAPIASTSGDPSVGSSGATSTPPCTPGPGTPPFTIDVLFIHSPGGTTADVRHRFECEPAPHDPWSALRSAVDAELGRPYR